jgi:hypothetical protein
MNDVKFMDRRMINTMSFRNDKFNIVLYQLYFDKLIACMV